MTSLMKSWGWEDRRALKRPSLYPERLPSRISRLNTFNFKFYSDDDFFFFLVLVKASPMQYLGHAYNKKQITYLQFKFN